MTVPRVSDAIRFPSERAATTCPTASGNGGNPFIPLIMSKRIFTVIPSPSSFHVMEYIAHVVYRINIYIYIYSLFLKKAREKAVNEARKRLDKKEAEVRKLREALEAAKVKR